MDLSPLNFLKHHEPTTNNFRETSITRSSVFHQLLWSCWKLKFVLIHTSSYFRDFSKIIFLFYIVLDCQMLPRGSVHTSWSTPKHQGDPDERPHSRGQLGPAKQEPWVCWTLQNPLEKGGSQVKQTQLKIFRICKENSNENCTFKYRNYTLFCLILS